MLSEYLNKSIYELTLFEAMITLILLLLGGAVIIGVLLWGLRRGLCNMRLPEPKPGEVNPFLERLLARSDNNIEGEVRSNNGQIS